MKSWADNFTYAYYEAILSVLKKQYQFKLFFKAPQVLEKTLEKPVVFLRHDIDLDMAHALKMAELEQQLNISSCYMIMTTCPFYSLQDTATINAIKNLHEMGHEIGLHFDIQTTNNSNMQLSKDTLILSLDMAAAQLENIISEHVRSVSFHRPLQSCLYGPLFIGNRINCYAKVLMNWYLSDSKGVWLEGEPLPILLTPKHSTLQLLTHPIWYGAEHINSREKLEMFFVNKTHRLNANEVRDFDKALAAHLTIKRQGIIER